MKRFFQVCQAVNGERELEVSTRFYLLPPTFMAGSSRPMRGVVTTQRVSTGQSDMSAQTRSIVMPGRCLRRAGLAFFFFVARVEMQSGTARRVFRPEMDQSENLGKKVVPLLNWLTNRAV